MRLVAEVFVAFLKLGLTAFGGPIAHLGYFHRELVERRRWFDEALYAQLVALCQFLPGPTSSQLGFAMGLVRAGGWGALAAFLAFTLPSALLMFTFAYLLPLFDRPYGRAGIYGLKLVAVVVVAQGVLAMARRLTPDMPRRLIAVASAAVILASGTALAQLLVVAMGALLGLLFGRQIATAAGASFELPHTARSGAVWLIVYAVLLMAAFTLATTGSPLAAVAAAFYRAGALVFGGGHVVLPMLQAEVVRPGWVSDASFLAGYGAAQALPGPMFSLAAFLGARLENGQGGLIGAGASLGAIFLPGFLLVAGVLPTWRAVISRRGAMSALAGVNAAVVGLLAAALYDPLWIGAVHAPADFVTALIGFLLLSLLRLPILAAVAWCVLVSLTRAWLAAGGG